MRTWTFSTILGVCTCAASSLFGQAVAEGAMVHANSAAATAKVGSTLGSALGSVMSGNAEKMKPPSATKIEHVPHGSRNALVSRSGEQSASPLKITAIRGGTKPCTATPSSLQSASNSSNRPKHEADAEQGTQTTPATPAAPPPPCSVASGAQYPSKSVVNITFPK